MKIPENNIFTYKIIEYCVDTRLNMFFEICNCIFFYYQYIFICIIWASKFV